MKEKCELENSQVSYVHVGEGRVSGDTMCP